MNPLSSILKALKKVEVETQDKDSLLAWPAGLDTRATLRRRARVKRMSHYALRLAVAAACVLGIGAGWYFLSGRGGEAHKAADVQTAPALPDNSSRMSGAPAAGRGQSRAAAKVLAARRVSREKAIGTQTAAGAPAAAKPIRPAAVQRPAVNARAESEAAGPQSAETIPLLSSDQGKLTLQAISWTEHPEGRIAVINGQILKEGAAVEGYTIRRIRPDDVVVRSGTNDWRLVFSPNPP